MDWWNITGVLVITYGPLGLWTWEKKRLGEAILEEMGLPVSIIWRRQLAHLCQYRVVSGSENSDRCISLTVKNAPGNIVIPIPYLSLLEDL
jgi:hypothetical protein